jgi:hypothetical protein
MVKSRVEAGNLRQCRMKLCERIDGGKIMGLMQRRQRNKVTQLREHRRIDEHRRHIERPAMHHPMSSHRKPVILKMAFQPTQQRGQSLFVRGAIWQMLVAQRASSAVVGGKVNAMPDTLVLTFANDALSRWLVTSREYRELDA